MNDKLLYKDQKLCEHFQKTFVVYTKTSSTISPRLTCFNLLSLDINECSDGTHICEDLCINTEPGYNCTCSEGSLLSSDLHTCDGINLIFFCWRLTTQFIFDFLILLHSY